MRINKVKNMSKNVASGIIYRLISILFPFFIRTIILHVLSSEYLGLSSLFTAILQALNLMEVGIGTALVFNMYAHVASDDKEKLSNYMMFYKKCYTVIGTMILVIGIMILPFIKYFINGSYPADINIYILYLLYLLNTIFSYVPLAYKNSIALAYQRTDIETNALSISHFLMFGTQIVVLLLFKNYYIYTIAMPIFMIVKNLLISRKIDKTYPEIKAKGQITKEEQKKIIGNIKSLFGHQVAFTVINSADNIVISMMLGLNDLAIYNNYYYIIAALINVVTIIFTSIQAGIGNSIIVDEKEVVYTNYTRFRVFVYTVVLSFSVCLYLLYQPFMKIWMGKSMMLSDFDVLIFTIGFYITQIRRVVTTYKNAAGLWKEDFLKPYLWIVVDIIFDIIFIPIFGVVGAMLATTVSCIIIAMPVEIHVLYKKLLHRNEIDQYAFMVKEILLFAACIGVSYLITKNITVPGVLGLAFYIAVAILILSLVIILTRYGTSEFKWMCQRIKHLFKKEMKKN